MSQSLVKSFYAGEVHYEWRRLVQDAYHRLEFLTTLRYLDKYLPHEGRLLDAGGGPGRYTMELAQRGYRVTLLDLTPENVDFAGRMIRRKGLKRRAEAVEGTITDLSRYADGTFDGVVCTGGPVSHILDPGQRTQTIRELLRVAKDGAPVFISVMSRLSVIVVELKLFQHELELPVHTSIRETGDIDGLTGFTECHFFLPEELRAELGAQGAQVIEMVGLEGLAANHRKEINRLAKNETRWKVWLETHFQLCTHPVVVGISEHMLAVCKK